MKKHYVLAGIALAMIFSLNSCNKEIDNPNDNKVIKEGTPFEIIATPVQTRTENDGMDTKWVADDAINVFHAVEGTTTYVSDGEFTISDVTTNRFQGTVSETLNPEKKYDWYMIYPYNQYLESVDNQSENPARYYIGGRSDKSQEQDGNNNKAHLAGTNFPLYGVVSALAATKTPSVSVNHVASYIEVVVTNKNEEPLTVESVSFTAPDGEKIAGYFNINFAADPMEFTMYNTYASETASLTVKNGTEIASGQTGSFYLGIKPFSLSSGVLKVAVNGYEKEIAITKNTSFSAGKIKKINFAYDEDLTPVTDFKWNLVTSADQIVAGAEVVIAASNANFAMSQTQNQNNRAAASIAKQSTQITWDNASLVQVFEVVAGSEDGTFAFKCADGAQKGKYIYAASSGSNYLRTQDGKDANASWTITIDESNVAKMIANGENTRNELRFNPNNNNPMFSCYASTSTTGSPVALYMKGETADPNAKAIISNGNIEVEAPGVYANYEGAYILKNIDEAEETVNLTASENILDPSALSGNISFSMAPNYTTNKVTGQIVLTLASDETVTATIPVEQKASSLKVSATEVVIPADATEITFTVTSPEFNWTIVAEDDTKIAFDEGGVASASATTVTVISDVEAGENVQTITTLTVSRTEDDPQAKTIVVKKAKATTEGELSAGTVLWSESFGSAGTGVTKFDDAAQVSTYDYDGRTGYSTNATSVTLNADNNVRLSSSSANGVASGHLWFNKQAKGVLTTSAISLFGVQKVKFSFSKAKGAVKAEYSTDNSTWTELGVFTTNASTASYDIEVSADVESIYFRLTENNNSNALRVDNLQLVVAD